MNITAIARISVTLLCTSDLPYATVWRLVWNWCRKLPSDVIITGRSLLNGVLTVWTVCFTNVMLLTTFVRSIVSQRMFLKYDIEQTIATNHLTTHVYISNHGSEVFDSKQQQWIMCRSLLIGLLDCKCWYCSSSGWGWRVSNLCVCITARL